MIKKNKYVLEKKATEIWVLLNKNKFAGEKKKTKSKNIKIYKLTDYSSPMAVLIHKIDMKNRL